MPRRNDIQKILVIGSGPIVIGQACEFDYSGTQAVKALKEEGYFVILINSNPATIMTDPEYADRTYIEPINWQTLEKIIQKERPDALLPTVGGQTALNVTMDLDSQGILEKYQVELIGANIDSISKAEDRKLFKEAMSEIDVDVPKSGFASNLDQAREILDKMGLPIIVRPAYTMGGSGGNIVFNKEEFDSLVLRGLDASPISQILLEESILGWKEFELEVMRDLNDNVVIICSIENFDPMGIHTGDSITVAPQQTLTDRQYQRMRDESIKIIRKIGVDTGGSNIQFGVNPENNQMVVIEMNPRVSRSSALASKATGFPIAKIAAKLAVGYTLDEIPNDITKKTPASFEPTIDYVVVKTPRWAFEKFPGVNHFLGPQMKSVGEAMAIGRTFQESLQKALRSLEIDRYGLGMDGSGSFMRQMANMTRIQKEEYFQEAFISCDSSRIFLIHEALRSGYTVEKISEMTSIDPWFLNQIQEIIDMENFYSEWIKDKNLAEQPDTEIFRNILREMKRAGFSDRQLAFMEIQGEVEPLLLSNDPKDQKEGNRLLYEKERGIRKLLTEAEILKDYKRVDTCGGEFQALTPYMYGTYEDENECNATAGEKVIIIGSGPNRIGQGIEFDYCCCHASFALREEGIESIMINSNPETVSTDYDTSDRLYFEPLTIEDILSICKNENPRGVIIQFGGQTPLKLSSELKKEGIKILGTQPEAIDRSENRKLFSEVVNKLKLNQPMNGLATNIEEALKIASKINYPLLVRPSYVIGGRAMAIVYDESGLGEYIESAVDLSPDHPILIDQFLEDSIEIDVDAIFDGEDIVIAGIMEHIEEAGVHSGDSACILPPQQLSAEILEEIELSTTNLAKKLGVLGLLNIQYAIKNNKLYVLEVNPRASRTIPFVSKAIGYPIAKIATKVILGKKLSSFGIPKHAWHTKHISVKEVVLPFKKFPGVDTLLGPEMKSTGEVMGISYDFASSFFRATTAAGDTLPEKGNIFFSINKKSKFELMPYARKLQSLGFGVYCTKGTAEYFEENDINCKEIKKIHEGRPNIIDFIKSGEIQLVINTPSGKIPRKDAAYIRQAAVQYGVPSITTIPGAKAAITGIESIIEQRKNNIESQVKSIQDYHRDIFP